MSGSISTVLSCETLILDVESETYSSLHALGTVVWGLLKNQIGIVDLQEAMFNDFDVSPEECSANLLSFLQELEDNKLIEVRSGANT